MAQQPPARNWLLIIAKNFINSLKPRRFTGDLVGKDHFGTKYFEIPPNPSSARRKPTRYFEPVIEDDFDQELPPEWEAWLRGRRKQPPTEEEIAKNLAIKRTKKENAKVVDAKAGQKTVQVKGMESFPQYDEYELIPGKKKEN